MKKTLLLIALLLITGCVKPKGEFAFKKFDQDVYRRYDEPLQFGSNERINWVYKFKNLRKINYNINVTLLKKEVIWIDIDSRTEGITRESGILYGTIENLKQGDYKIILFNNNIIIDEMEFRIFSDDEEYYDYDNID